MSTFLILGSLSVTLRSTSSFSQLFSESVVYDTTHRRSGNSSSLTEVQKFMATQHSLCSQVSQQKKKKKEEKKTDRLISGDLQFSSTTAESKFWLGEMGSIQEGAQSFLCEWRKRSEEE